MTRRNELEVFWKVLSIKALAFYSIQWQGYSRCCHQASLRARRVPRHWLWACPGFTSHPGGLEFMLVVRRDFAIHLSLFSREHHRQTRLLQTNTSRSECIILSYCTAEDTNLKNTLRTGSKGWLPGLQPVYVSCLYMRMAYLKEIKPFLFYFSNFYNQSSFWKH